MAGGGGVWRRRMAAAASNGRGQDIGNAPAAAALCDSAHPHVGSAASRPGEAASRAEAIVINNGMVIETRRRRSKGVGMQPNSVISHAGGAGNREFLRGTCDFQEGSFLAKTTPFG